MIKGDVIFCATGITDGVLVKGIECLKTKFRSETYITHKSSKLFTKLSEDIQK
jgi:fructose-1,6-bisphosphatase/sedoheptulose 1,7-bisphosphatase-like protein